MKKVFSPLIFLVLLVSFAIIMLAGCAQYPGPADNSRLPVAAPIDTAAPNDATAKPSAAVSALSNATAGITADGIYSTKEDVARYIEQFGKLPKNFITKKEAQKLGWSGGSLEPYAPKKCIGGNRFGNYEGNLPEKKGRYYMECDIDTLGAASRGAKRIVFSNDGLVYYTDDHYANFTLLYGDEKE